MTEYNEPFTEETVNKRKKRSMSGNINEDVEEPTSIDESVPDGPETAPEPVVNKEAEEWKSKYMYTMADFDNYRRNALKEKETLIKTASERVIKDILPIIDDFDRSFEYMDEQTANGVMLIYNKFVNVLKKNNVTQIEPKDGDSFDSNLHEAVTAIPAVNGEPGTVVECISKGYAISGKVIRYAKVVVRQM